MHYTRVGNTNDSIIIPLCDSQREVCHWNCLTKSKSTGCRNINLSISADVDSVQIIDSSPIIGQTNRAFGVFGQILLDIRR